MSRFCALLQDSSYDWERVRKAARVHRSTWSRWRRGLQRPDVDYATGHLIPLLREELGIELGLHDIYEYRSAAPSRQNNAHQ